MPARNPSGAVLVLGRRLAPRRIAGLARLQSHGRRLLGPLQAGPVRAIHLVHGGTTCQMVNPLPEIADERHFTGSLGDRLRRLVSASGRPHRVIIPGRAADGGRSGDSTASLGIRPHRPARPRDECELEADDQEQGRGDAQDDRTDGERELRPPAPWRSSHPSSSSARARAEGYRSWGSRNRAATDPVQGRGDRRIDRPHRGAGVGRSDPGCSRGTPSDGVTEPPPKGCCPPSISKKMTPGCRRHFAHRPGC